MRYLPDNPEWKNQKGEIFESLVGELLEILYPKSFKRTQMTHDGGKDFTAEKEIFFENNMRVWVECKCLKSNLSLDDMGRTIVLTYLNNVKVLAIFSYTPVNKNLKECLQQFSQKANVCIKLYDGENLEKLILKHKNNINFDKYFPDWNEKYEISYSQKISADVYVSKFKDIYNNESNVTFLYKDLVWMNCKIINETTDLKTVQLKINKSSLNNFYVENRYLINNDFCIKFELHDNQSQYYAIPLRIKNFKKTLKLPIVEIYDQDNNLIKKINKTIKCQWFSETSIVGESYLKIIKSADNYAQGMSFVSILGASGMGKTRIIKELSINAINNGFDYFNIDIEKNFSSLQIIIQKIIINYEGLPLINPNIMLDQELFANIKETNARRIYAKNLLYRKDFENVSANEIARYFIELFKEKKCEIHIDNVQYCDDKTIDVLKEIIALCNNEHMTSRIVMAFNEDRLYKNTPVYNLYKYLLIMNSKSPLAFPVFKLKGFTEEDANIYLRNSIRLDDGELQNENNYARTLSLIVQKCGCNPYILTNIVSLLYEKNIIKKSENAFFYVANIKTFHQCLSLIPENIKDLLQLRNNYFIEFLDKQYEATSYSIFLCAIAIIKIIPKTLALDILINPEILASAINTGFFSIEGENIVFAHSYMEQFFTENYCSCSNDIMRLIITKIEKLHLVTSLFAPYFILKYKIGELDNDLCERAMRHLSRVDRCYLKDYVSVLSNIIADNEYITDSKKFLKDAIHICNISQSSLGMDYTYNLYEKFSKLIILNAVKYVNDKQLITKFTFSHSSALLVLSKYSAVIETVNQYLLLFCENMDLICRLKERLAVAYMKIGNYKLSKTLFNELYDYANQIANVNNRIEALLHLGKINILECNEKELKTNWSELCNVYLHEFNKDIDNKYERKKFEFIYNQCGSVIDFLNGDIESADKKFKKIMDLKDNTGMPYYEIRIRLFCVTYNIMRHYDRVNYPLMRALIEDALDISVFYNENNIYPKSFYLLAQLNMICNKKEKALDNYKITLDIYNEMELPSLKNLEYNLIHDIYICLLENEIKIDNHELGLIINNRQYIADIMNYKTEKVFQFVKNTKYTVPLF